MSHALEPNASRWRRRGAIWCLAGLCGGYVGSGIFLKRYSVDFIAQQHQALLAERLRHPTLYAPGAALPLDAAGAATARPYLLEGWSYPEGWGRWTDGPAAGLALRLTPAPAAPLRLVADLRHVFIPPGQPTQEVEVLANDRPVGQWSFRAGEPLGERAVLIPPKTLGPQGALHLAFRVHHPAAPAPDGAGTPRRLGLGLAALRLDSAPAPYAPGTALPLDAAGAATARPYLLEGWSYPEGWGRWTDGPAAGLALRLTPAPAAPLRLVADLRHVFIPPGQPTQEVEVLANDRPVGQWSFRAGEPLGERAVLIPPKTLGPQGALHLAFRVHHPAAPAPDGAGTPRRLGLGLAALRLDSAPAPYAPGTALPLDAAGAATARPYLLEGWSYPEGWGRWTDGPAAGLALRLTPAPTAPPRLVADLRHVFIPPGQPTQEVEVLANDRPVGQWSFRAGEPLGERAALIPPETLGPQGALHLAFRVHHPAAPAPDGAGTPRRLGLGLAALRLDSAPAPYAPGTALPLDAAGAATARPYLLEGWSYPEGWGRWTDGPAAGLALRLTPAPAAPLRLVADLRHVFIPPGQPTQEVEVLANDRPVGQWSFRAGEPLGERAVLIPPDAFGPAGDLRLTFRVRHPAAPREAGTGNNDSRRLGLGLAALRLDVFSASPPRASAR